MGSQKTPLGWHTVAAVIAGMRRVDPSVMPVLLLPPPPVLRCVDAGTQLAPAFVPPGWKRYVLEAHPTGSCGQYPFVMLSVAAPRSVIARASSSRDRGNRASAVG